MDLVRRVEAFIEHERLSEPEDGILVAVSGGPDSVALLHILFLLSGRWRWKLAAAYVNHRFRGEEADQEAKFVAAWCARLGIPCEVGDIDVPAYIRQSGLNPQAAAREKRYGFLEEAAEKHGCERIALAHHADDQAETVLMRLLRGTGPAGLAGMPVRRTVKKMELIRPLLRIYKMELLQYCRDNGLAFRIDSSNEKRDYTRNRLRLDIMPELIRFNPKLPETINRLAEVMEGEDAYLERETRALFDRFVRRLSGEMQFSRERFMTLHLALQRRLIKLILDYLSSESDQPDFARTEAFRLAVLQPNPPSLTLDYSERVRLVREYDLISFAADARQTVPYSFVIGAENGEIGIPGTDIRLEFHVSDNSDSSDVSDQPQSRFDSGKDAVSFDLDELKFPLTVRGRMSGDRIDVWGLNGSKKVKDIFIDDKVPPSKRDRLPLLVDSYGTILWIPGIRRSAHAAVTDRTRRLFLMKRHET